MNQCHLLSDVARIPLPGDNTAIATRRLEAGTIIEYEGKAFSLDSTILEGHRFVAVPIKQGASLLSWGLPFGTALRDLQPGAYACSERILLVLRGREVPGSFVSEPSFRNAELRPYRLSQSGFKPGVQVARTENPRHFLGFPRPASRGTGTRNYIVLLGTTSRASSFVKTLEAKLSPLAGNYPNIDGIAAVAHTEGGLPTSPNNRELLLRTLSGFAVHPNVGAVLIVDNGDEPVNNRALEDYLLLHKYPLDEVPHRFMSLNDHSYQDAVAAGEHTVRGWLDEVNGYTRESLPASELSIALQCGGSDAFSGVSGNPLAGWVAKQVIRNGGRANLAETDELIGAESYILQNTRDRETAEQFLKTIERFKQLLAWHGYSAEGNPSGGNLFRGLYNITLKSIGAAMKRDPEVCLDYVIQYAERLRDSGFYFMDSPGNDLESVAGQVASGCNMIFFVTGNGSVTNFPFVPTIKFITTTDRYNLLPNEMDVNAGAYLDGTPMDELGSSTFDLTLETASGKRSKGELAGHSQVSIWRNWAQTELRDLTPLRDKPLPAGTPLKVGLPRHDILISAKLFRTEGAGATERLGLILPTSLCSSQIARLIAARLNEKSLGSGSIDRYVALPHTEGCGVTLGNTEDLYVRVLLGYLLHPNVQAALLLEHGCEKTHNDYMRASLREHGMDSGEYGWASVQMDGGIAKVGNKIEEWFASRLKDMPRTVRENVRDSALSIALASTSELPRAVAETLAEVALNVVRAGGNIIVPENTPLLASNSFLSNALGGSTLHVTLAHGQVPSSAGFHVMECPTEHWVETLSGLGASGAQLAIVYTAGTCVQSHPMVPVIHISTGTPHAASDDLDLVLSGDSDSWTEDILRLVGLVGSGEYTPRLYGEGNVDFQITRGLLGVST